MTLNVPPLDNLRTYLESRVIGQKWAIDSIIKPLNIGLAGLLPPNRPVAVLFFAGPTGVGKTELAARALPDYLHEGEKLAGIEYPNPPLQRIDSGSIGFGATRLVGTAPGYIGSRSHKEGATKPILVQDNFPQDRIMVLVFDEIEKAFGYGTARGTYWDQELMSILMPLLDEGLVFNQWDSAMADLRKTIVIFTSNIGAKRIQEEGKKRIGFFGRKHGTSNHLTEDEVEKLNQNIDDLTKEIYVDFFPPEFRNRQDRLVVFRFLGRSDFALIFDKEIKLLQDLLLSSNGISLAVSPDVKEWFLNHGVIREDGVRSLQRAILRKLRYPLATFINMKEFGEGDSIEVDVDDSDKKEARFNFSKSKS